MAKNQWGKGIFLILIGIVLGNLLSQNEATREFLFRYIPSQWGLPMGLIILVVALIVLMIWYSRLENNDAQISEAKLNAIIQKLGISQEDIYGTGGNIMPKSKSQPPLTKKRFEGLLRKSAQPLKPDSKETGTSESHPSDGCNGKRKNQDKTEGKED